MDITLAEGERVALSISPRRRSDGRPGSFASPVVWSAAVTGDGNGIVVIVADDAMSAIIRARVAGTIGTLTLDATTFRGSPISEMHTITVTSPVADDFGIELGEIVPDEVT